MVLGGPACFLAPDAVSALAKYFDVPAELTERCIAMAVTLAEMRRDEKSRDAIDAMIERVNANADKNRWAICGSRRRARSRCRAGAGACLKGLPQGKIETEMGMPTGPRMGCNAVGGWPLVSARAFQDTIIARSLRGTRPS